MKDFVTYTRIMCNSTAFMNHKAAILKNLVSAYDNKISHTTAANFVNYNKPTALFK